MTKKETIKTGVRLAMFLGTETIMTNIITFTNPLGSMNLIKRASVYLTSIAMGGLVSDILGEYTDKKIDEFVDDIKRMRSEESEVA